MYQVSYTWSHNMADFVDNLTGGSTPQNAYDYAHEMSNSPQDVRHRFVGSAAWALPVGRGGLVLNNDSGASKLIGGWQANAIVSLQTGVPFDVTASDLSDTESIIGLRELRRRCFLRGIEESLSVCRQQRTGLLHQCQRVRAARSWNFRQLPAPRLARPGGRAGRFEPVQEFSARRGTQA